MTKGREAMKWTPTRAAGLARLQAFLPSAGYAYTRGRNVDRGPEDRSNVSALSPWIRRRMITEHEVVAAVLAQHGLVAAEKFIQEVYWRTYWKGWLELRPGVWRRFEDDHAALSASWQGNRTLEAARRGETGIEAFDQWTHELLETGWMHNHARMWYASIWIFTLRLPWQLGAGLFYDHLLDADPAANTLSWRWVAGLQTRGKHYLARAANIRDNTLGRFNPSGQVDEDADPIVEDAALPAPTPAPRGETPSTGRVALLLTEEDLHPESWPMEAAITDCAALAMPPHGAPESPAAAFSRGALADALGRTKDAFGPEGLLLSPAEIADWASRTGVTEVVTGFAAVGPIACCLDEVEHRLQAQGQRLVRLQRTWDTNAWPHATAGFFKVKEQIPRLVMAAMAAEQHRR